MTDPLNTSPPSRSAAASPPPPGGRGWRGLLVAGLGLLAVVLLALLVIRRPPVATALVNFLLARVTLAPRAIARVDQVRGHWLGGIELDGLRVTRGDTLLARIDTLRASYRLQRLCVGRIDVREFAVRGVLVTADLRDTTRRVAKRPPLTLGQVLSGRFYTGWPVNIEQVSLRDATIGGRATEPDSGSRSSRLAVRAHAIRLGKGFAFELDSLTTTLFPAGGRRDSVAFTLAGGLAGGRVELRTLRFLGAASDVEGHGALSVGAQDSLQSAGLTLHARPLALADLAGFLPGPTLAGELHADVDLTGTRTDRLSGTVHATLGLARIGEFELGPLSLDATMEDGNTAADASVRFEQATVTLHGTGSPLSREPRYVLDLHADRLPARLPGLAWWPAFAERAGARLESHIHGSGYATATLTLTGRVSGDCGELAWDGGLSLGAVTEWRLRALMFDRLDVARLLGQPTPSAFRGEASASGSVARDGANRAQAELRLAPSRFGELHVHVAELHARVEGAVVTGTLRAESDAGSVAIESFTASTAPEGDSKLHAARFAELDLARLLHQPALTSRLNGTLDLEAHGLARIASHAAAPHGWLDSGPSADATLTLAKSTFRGQPIARGQAHVTLARGGATATAVLASEAGALELLAHARPFDDPASVRLDRLRFDSVDLAAWTGAGALHSDLDGTLTGECHAGATAGAPASGSAGVMLERSQLGQATLDGGNLNTTLALDRVRVEGSLRAAGHVLDLHANGSLERDHLSGAAELDVPFGLIAAVAGRESLTTQGGLAIQARFARDSSSPPLVSGEVRGHGSMGRARLDTLAAAFRLERGLLVVDTLLARSNAGVARGGGRVAVDRTARSRSSRFEFHFTTDDVSALRELVRADTLDVASAMLDVTLTGTDSLRTMETRGTLRSLVWNGLRLGGAELSASGNLGGDWRPATAMGNVLLRQLQGGPIPIRDARIAIESRGPEATIAIDATADERTNGRARARARFDSLVTVVTLDTLALHADTTDWRLTRPARAELQATRTHIDALELRSRDGRLSIRGGIDRRGDQDLDVELSRVALNRLGSVSGRGDLGALVDGRLSLRGPAASPSAQGQATVSLFTAGRPAGTLSTSLQWAERRLRAEGRLATPASDSLAWSAQLPLAFSLAAPDPKPPVAPRPALEGDVNVLVRAQAFPLASLSVFLDPRSVGPLEGTLDVDARLTGDERSLAGSGSLEVSGGVLPLPALGVTYRDLDVKSEFQGDRLVLKRARLASGKGLLTASGDVRFVSVTHIEPRLHVKTDRFVFVQTPDLHAMATSDVEVSGTLTAPVVQGSVTVGNSSLYFTQPDLAAASASGDVQLSPADIRMMEETFGYVAPRAPELPLLIYDASDLDLKIRMERDNWVRQRVPPKLAVALTGDFRLRKLPHAEPELTGRIEPIANRGYVQQFARSFDIIGGEVLLNGKMKDHSVAIHAQYKPESGLESSSSTDVVVKLDVEGSVEHLKLTLSSEPAMSEAEIVSYIATGRSSVGPPTTSSNSQNSSLLRDIGLSQLAGPAENAAQQAVGLDVLEVRFDPLRGATLVAGRYVDPQLYVGFRSPLQYGEASTINASTTSTNSTAFEVEYAISRWLVLNMQGETSKFRSFFRARHAY